MKLPTFLGVIVSCVSVIAVGNIRATHSANVSSLKACRLPSSDSTTEGICVPISLCPPMVELKFQLKFAAVRPYVCHIDQQSSTNGDKIHVCCRVSAIKCHGYRQEVKKLAERWDPLGTILSLKPTSASSQQLTHAKANGGRTQHSKKVCPGEPGEFTALIVNGMPAEPDEFPHMVALGMYKIGMGLHFPCGGSLISDKWVLTAAHCFKEALTIVRIYNGIQEEYNKFDTRRDFYIQERIIHPGYRGSRDTAYADLALVRLQEDGYFVPVKITLRAHPGCLSQFDPELLVNKDTQIVGWGVTRNLGQKSQHLLKGRVPILPKENCSAAISRNYVLRSAYTLGAGNGILCGLDSVQHSDACQGDSGGPMCIRGPHCVYDIVGVVSKGVNCGSKFPGFYIDVFYYLDWIEREVWPVKSVLAELRAEAKDNNG